jgi:Uma2 family endonuclease
MWGLEYALLFGVPKNKPELIDGQTRCAFPFLNREQAEAHLTAWVETLCRWKQIATAPAVHKDAKEWRVEARNFQLTLYPLPIDLRIPLDFDAFVAIDSSFWRRDLWAGQPASHETGWEDRQRHFDVQLNLWTLFGDYCRRYGGRHSGRVDLSLSDTTNVAPDQYYFRASAKNCLRHDYFWGVPDLVAEVLSPATRAIDRGPRKNLYRRAGVPHLWLLDPEVETVELHDLEGDRYHLTATHGAGTEFRPVLFPGQTVAVDRLFDTQWKRHPEWFGREEEAEPIPRWLVAPEIRVGLEYLLLMGHPERRYEIWSNRAPCMLAFGSAEEARLRLEHLLDEAASWEQAARPQTAVLDSDAEQAEVGRFRFTRRGRHVHLDVAVDARKYQELLCLWSDRAVWDWGEE